MKKRVLAALIISTALFASACAAPAATPSTSSESSEASGATAEEAPAETEAAPAPESSETSGDQITLRFSWWGGDARHEATIKAIEAYEAEHPNIKIEPEYQGWDGYTDKVLSQLAGGTQPDIMQVMATAAAEYVDSFPDSFVNLDEQDIFDVSTFDKNMIDNFGMSNSGHIVAVPTGVNSYNLVVNKTVTDADGVELPENMTWEEFIDYGKKIHEANPDHYLITLNDDNCRHLLFIFTRQYGEQWFVSPDYKVIDDREALIKGFEMIQRLYDEGVAEPMETAFAYNGDVDANKKLLNNEIATTYRASSSIVNLDTSGGMELDVINLPIDPDAKASGVLTQPSQIMMVSNNANKEESLKFMEWFYNSEEAAKILTDCRGVPPTQNARDTLTEAGLGNAVVTKAVSIAMEVTDEPMPTPSENTEVIGFVNLLMQEVCYKTITPEEAADTLIENLNEIVDSFRPTE